MKKKKLVLAVANLITYGFAVWTILAWYDWKLLIILILFLWANNLSIKANSL